jgi:hypothetical protein
MSTGHSVGKRLSYNILHFQSKECPTQPDGHFSDVYAAGMSLHFNEKQKKTSRTASEHCLHSRSNNAESCVLVYTDIIERRRV